jgi:hypothetical protein
MDRTIVLRSFVVAAILSVLAYLAFGPRAAFAIAVGALIAGANFRLASGMLRKIVVPGEKPSVAKFKGALSFFIRYVFVAIILAVAIKSGVHPVFLLVGVSALVIAILGSTFKLIKSAGAGEM